MIFDIIPDRHLDLSSIGYHLLPKSVPAGSAVSSHLDACCRYFVFNSSCRAATELVSTHIASRIIRRVPRLNPEV
eukprot:6595058-Pyramimonas_sp.AAC.1